MKYIDLDLPSGTLWADVNENDFYTFSEAVSKYGNSLPTKEQFEELKDYCKWEWIGDGYKITGHNGNSIVLSADGYRYNEEDVDCVGTYGCYWSSTSEDSDYAWYLDFDSGGAGVYFGWRRYGFSVRLIKER